MMGELLPIFDALSQKEITQLLNAIFPFFLLLLILTVIFLLFPSKRNVLMYNLDKCFPGLKEALEGDLEQANNIYFESLETKEQEELE